MTSTHTSILASFAAGIRYDRLPGEVVSKAKWVLLDAIGCALAAFKEDPRKARIAVEVAEKFGMGTSGSSTVIGSLKKNNPAVAALANGILVNAADNDDTHKRALAHLGSVVVPAALAAAESRLRHGRDLIAAIVAGYEVAARVGMAVMPSHYRFWHSTATNGTFGGAAAAANAWGMDSEAMRVAFGFAGTQAAGLNAFFESGDDSKSVHPGKAAFNGILSAMLADVGATSSPDILGHEKGYLAAFSLEPDAAALTDQLEMRWEILTNGFKLYPSILASHSPIGASLEIFPRLGHRMDRIRAVEVRTYATVKSHFSNKTIESAMSARLSVPYCVAAALTDGEMTQSQFSESRFRDPAILGLLEKVEVIVDPQLSPLYPEKFPARVVVTLDDGSQEEATHLYPKGDPANPLTDEELLQKFHRNAEGVLSAPAMNQLLRVLREIENHDVSDLTALLCFGGV
jgi:2-methylcitrate dehydratase PrpD